MATDSNMGFHQPTAPSLFCNRHMVSFQSGAADGSSRVFPARMDGSIGVNSMEGVILAGNPRGINDAGLLIPGGNAVRGLHLDPATELNHGIGLAVDWSSEEQSLLEEGIAKYANEPNIMRYIKIAALLQSKTVRDVALRCRWMTKKESGKRRKQEEYCTWKKMKDRKEKQVDRSLRANAVSSPLPNSATCSLIMDCCMNRKNCISCEVPVIDGATRCLLEGNAQLLGQIKVNLETSKLQDNVDLFFHTKNNITSIINRMSEMPGIMGQMPPLPVSINDQLASAILPAPKAIIFGAPGSIHLKQEPRY